MSILKSNGNYLHYNKLTVKFLLCTILHFMRTVSPTAADMFLGCVSSNIGIARGRVEFGLFRTKDGVGLDMEVPRKYEIWKYEFKEYKFRY